MKLFNKESQEWTNVAVASPSQPRELPLLLPIGTVAHLINPPPIPPASVQKDGCNRKVVLVKSTKIMQEKNVKRNTLPDDSLPTRLSARKRSRTTSTEVEVDIIKPALAEPEFILPDMDPPEQYVSPPGYLSSIAITTNTTLISSPLQSVNSVTLRNGVIVQQDYTRVKTNNNVHMQMGRLVHTETTDIPVMKTDYIFDVPNVSVAPYLAKSNIPNGISITSVPPGECSQSTLEIEPNQAAAEANVVLIADEEQTDLPATTVLSTPKPMSQDRVTKKEREDIIAGRVEIPGLIPSFVGISDLPITIPQKTNYLKAGLLSTCFKKDRNDTSGEEIVRDSDIPWPKESLFPEMPDLGGNVQLPLDEPNYCLPYDIFCFGVTKTKSKLEEWIKTEEERRAEERLKRKQEARKKSLSSKTPTIPPVSWKYRLLRTNTYIGMNRPQKDEDQDHACECKNEPMKCSTEDCLNRVVYTECPATCGEECMNRRIQKRSWAKDLKLFQTKFKGFGVKTLTGIKKGDFILEYVGEVVTDAEFRRRMSEVYVNDTHHYCLHLDSGLVIDGHRSGDKGRFVNHSCEPNCEMQKWSVNGLHRMALFALQDIFPGEELSYDYNFSLYNEAEGQPCYCRSANCRGIIGGKVKARTPGQDQQSRKKKAGQAALSQNSDVIFFRKKTDDSIKALSRREVKFVRDSKIFLVRNYDKVGNVDSEEEKEVKEKLRRRAHKLLMAWASRLTNGSTKFKKQLVLTGENPRVAAIAKKAQVFFELFRHLTKAKNTSEGRNLLCELFMAVPLESDYPVFHQVFQNTKLNGLGSIGKSILECNYESLQQLEEDIRIVVTEFAQAYEAEEPEAISLLDSIRDVYKSAKAEALQVLEPFIEYAASDQGGNTLLPPFITSDNDLVSGVASGDEETILRCICGTFAEEGVLVQCSKCSIWQHCDCMRWPYDRDESGNSKNQSRKCSTSSGRGRGRPRKIVITEEQHSTNPLNRAEPMETEVITIDDDTDSGKNAASAGQDNAKTDVDSKDDYYCEKCQPREVNLEIPMGGPEDTAERTYYLTLLRDDGFLVRRNDTVYVLRDYPKDQRFLADGTLRPRLTYRDAGPLVADNCDILRIDRLWIDEEGNRMVVGYNYFRPNESFHERSRRFYPNEILRAPVPENINIEYIHGRCWVLDTNTFCIGRPIGSVEEHVYVCDFRVDKSGRIFNRIGGKKQGICTKSFAFNKFETKIKINRNIYPHGPPVPDFKVGSQLFGRGRPRSPRRSTADGNHKSRNKVSSAFELRERDKKRMRQAQNLHAVVDDLRKGIKNFSVDPVDLSPLLAKSLLTEERKTRKRKSICYRDLLE